MQQNNQTPCENIQQQFTFIHYIPPAEQLPNISQNNSSFYQVQQKSSELPLQTSSKATPSWMNNTRLRRKCKFDKNFNEMNESKL